MEKKKSQNKYSDSAESASCHVYRLGTCISETAMKEIQSNSSLANSTSKHLQRLCNSVAFCYKTAGLLFRKRPSQQFCSRKPLSYTDTEVLTRPCVPRTRSRLLWLEDTDRGHSSCTFLLALINIFKDK